MLPRSWTQGTLAIDMFALVWSDIVWFLFLILSLQIARQILSNTTSNICSFKLPSLTSEMDLLINSLVACNVSP